MYVITGATGNTGRPLTNALLEEGKPVRVITRNEEHARQYKEKDAEVFTGDSTDREFLAKAFEGAMVVYAMIPFNFAPKDYFALQKKHADAIVEAVALNEVPYVVTLSSVGAHLEKGAGVVAGLRYLEEKLNNLKGINVLHLRPSYFFENTLGMVQPLKQYGIFGSPIKKDLVMNMIATKDIGNYAAKRLSVLDFHGINVQYLLGRHDLTYSDVAKAYGKAIGKPDLEYTELSYDQFKNAFLQMGASESMVDNMIEFTKSLNEGRVLEEAHRDPESTTPTSLEEFAQTFAHVYNMKQ